MTSRLTRRGAMALGTAAAFAPLLPRQGRAAPLDYRIEPKPLGDGVWMIEGANAPITMENGGAIANVTILDTREGAVVVDAGPSHGYGVALRQVAETLTGKPVARVYLTHIHTDHVLGATAFSPDSVWTTPELAADLKLRGAGLTDAMYRVAGDWMRGSTAPEPQAGVTATFEDVGERRFRFMTLGGHTGSDLVLFEERSGLLIAGDLVFLDRAPTTPDADLARWRASLDTLAGVPHGLLAPGHGPAVEGAGGIAQTRDWLAMIEERIAAGFDRGLDVTELMAAPLPGWAEKLAVSRYEFARSVMHLLPRLEAERLPLVSG
ncbi:quinoprotein relay system zinc metallohydrolase 1 [Methylopila sp. M107]|uniref:quinoprotein relay system zinc metallohydrolase 1 n=1 Tax=Methylopila sp. M107 TaxID=1101190 RepID=UPI000368BD3A|nr:quinoprotein relay system zinc metallohydrolase 1 [Methylopila sp. M107]